MKFEWPNIVKTRELYLLFYAFTKKEFSSENLEFLVSVAKAKSPADYDRIHETFVKDDADKFINIASSNKIKLVDELAKANVAKKARNPPESEIEDYANYIAALPTAKKRVIKLLSDDTWKRFLKSELYTNSWMDKGNKDDKLLKIMNKIDITADYKGRNPLATKWKKMKTPLKNIKKALKEEELGDFVENWDEIKGIAKKYVDSHENTEDDARKERVNLLEEIKEYYDYVTQVFKKSGVDLEDLE